MDAYENSFAKQSLKIGSASFNSRDVTKNSPRCHQADLVLTVYKGMYSTVGKRRNSGQGLQKFEPIRRRTPSPPSLKCDIPANLTVGELLKKDKRKILDNASDLDSIDLDTKIGVDLDHYDQWARTRRPEQREVKATSPEPSAAQTKPRCVKSERMVRILAPKLERQRPLSFDRPIITEDRGVSDTTNELKTNVNDQTDEKYCNTQTSTSVSQNMKECNEDANNSGSYFYDSQKSYKITQWDSWSGRTPKIPRTVLRELKRSCGKIIKDVQKTSYETYCQLLSDDSENDGYTSLPGRRVSSCDPGRRTSSCRAVRTPTINPETEWIENLNYSSLTIQKPQSFLDRGHPLYQNCDDWNLNSERSKTVTFKLDVPKRCLSSRESSRREDLSLRNTAHYKMHLPLAKKEPMLFNNKNSVVDFRSKRIENLCKLCEKPGKNSTSIDSTGRTDFYPNIDRRSFQSTPGYSLTLNGHRQMRGRDSRVGAPTFKDALTLRNHASYRFCINREDRASDFVKTLGIDSKVAGSCI